MARLLRSGKVERSLMQWLTTSRSQAMAPLPQITSVFGLLKLRKESSISRSSTLVSMRALLVINNEQRRSLQCCIPTTTWTVVKSSVSNSNTFGVLPRCTISFADSRNRRNPFLSSRKRLLFSSTTHIQPWP